MSSVLTIESVSVRFGGVTALSGVSFDFPADSDIMGIIGPNGAGKSTLLSVVAGDIRPSDGGLRLFGRPCANWGPQTACRFGVARTFQIPRPFRRMTVFENLVVSGLSKLSMKSARCQADEILTLTELGLHRDSLPDQLNLASLKRLEIGRALMTEPRLLLLDEIFEGASQEDLYQLVALLRNYVRDHGTKLILVEHVIRAVREVCPWLVVLDNGELLSQGPTHQILRSEEVVNSYLGARLGAAIERGDDLAATGGTGGGEG